MFASEEAAEGMLAFREKRNAAWIARTEQRGDAASLTLPVQAASIRA